MSVAADNKNRWRVRQPEDLVWSNWDDDFVVFHRPSGSTHLFNPSSHFLLHDFLLEPRTLSDIVESLLPAEDGEPTSQAVNQIHALLDRFEQLGMVIRL